MRKILGSLMVFAALGGLAACGDAEETKKEEPKASTATTAKDDSATDDATDDATDTTDVADAVDDALDEANGQVEDALGDLDEIDFDELAKQAGSKECAAIALLGVQMLSSMSGESLPTSLTDEIDKNMPGELKDDAVKLSEFLEGLDMSDPNSLGNLSSPEFTEISDRLEAYMDANCEEITMG